MRLSLPVFTTALLIATLGSAELSAQEPTATAPGEVVERVVAVVGDSVLTLTEIQEYILMMRAQGEEIPTDPAGMAALQEQALDALIDQLLILQAAERDSTLIPEDEEIESRVNEMLAQTTERLGASGFQDALDREGMTQAEYREQLKQRIRRDQIQQMFMQSKLRDAQAPVVTEAEMRAVFEERKGALGPRPELVTMRQAVVVPEASEAAWTAARVRIDSVLARVRTGADFAELAKEFSMDATADVGGDLGWFRRGQMVKAFEDVAFRLGDGQVSQPTRTPFGWHLIKVDRVRPGEVKARHILIRPETGSGDADRARTVAEEIARRARAGEAMGTLLDEFADVLDEELPDSLTFPRERMSQTLPPSYQEPLAGVGEGGVAGPFEVQLRPDQPEWAVVAIIEVRPEGEYTFEDLRSQIEDQLRQRQLVESVLSGLRERTYVDVRLQ